jgi:hypothetical protein
MKAVVLLFTASRPDQQHSKIITDILALENENTPSIREHPVV